MINDMHGMFYSSDPEGTRAFLRDKLQIPHYDAGGGWLIFKFTAADMGCHPTDYPGSPPPREPTRSRSTPTTWRRPSPN